ncbi:MAG: hypothetical protein Q8N13_01195, partial [Acidovorax sp.]|nr:hypothetical protein [Acidovorax sp.]
VQGRLVGECKVRIAREDRLECLFEGVRMQGMQPVPPPSDENHLRAPRIKRLDGVISLSVQITRLGRSG